MTSRMPADEPADEVDEFEDALEREWRLIYDIPADEPIAG